MTGTIATLGPPYLIAETTVVVVVVVGPCIVAGCKCFDCSGIVELVVGTIAVAVVVVACVAVVEPGHNC